MELIILATNLSFAFFYCVLADKGTKGSGCHRRLCIQVIFQRGSRGYQCIKRYSRCFHPGRSEFRPLRSRFARGSARFGPASPQIDCTRGYLDVQEDPLSSWEVGKGLPRSHSNEQVILGGHGTAISDSGESGRSQSCAPFALVAKHLHARLQVGPFMLVKLIQ